MMSFWLSLRNAPVAVAALAILAGCGGSSSLPGAQTAARARQAPPPATESIMYRFRGTAHGNLPFGSLLYLNGVLYGTTDGGGSGPSGGDGTVFKITTSGHLTTLYSFQGGNDGIAPEAVGLVADSNGDLFGTTNYGGGAVACPYGGCGTVFELVPSGSGYKEKVLYAFQGAPDGATPIPGVTLGNDGSLYGTTVEGGTAGCSGEGASGVTGCGTVFKLTPISNKKPTGTSYTESVIHSFQGGPDGIGPRGKLLIDGSGALYGTTSYGGGASACSSPSGNLGCGMVFKLTPYGSSYGETILYDFQGGNDGSLPRAGLLAIGGGTLVGATTRGGGPHNGGTIYKLTPSGSGYTESVAFSFSGTAGVVPSDESGLIADGHGNLYGTTVAGGEYTKYNKCNCGTVFELSPSGSGYSETVLYAFKGTRDRDGVTPHDSLTMDSSGTLYGVTFLGGLYNKNKAEGTVFKVTP